MTDYDAERARFHWEVPERFNAVLDILERRAEQSPDELALVTLRRDGGVAASFTFRDSTWRAGVWVMPSPGSVSAGASGSS
ncbi:hypothetical protein [Streptomyces himastatinicus]|nr:hypothetical protein [Streptomyces himastatinicus]